jgi:hypothetical protein
MDKQGLISVDTGSGLDMRLELGLKGRLYHKHIAKVPSYWYVISWLTGLDRDGFAVATKPLSILRY